MVFWLDIQSVLQIILMRRTMMDRQDARQIYIEQIADAAEWTECGFEEFYQRQNGFSEEEM
jgi:hypothetical protein